MKKSFSLFKGAAFRKLGFLPFLMTFLFVAALQLDMGAQTWSTTGGHPANEPPARSMWNVPNGPFVTPAVAKERLIDAMKTLKNTLAIHAEDSAPYQSAFRRFSYYGAILEHLEAGKTVPQSIVDGLTVITNSLEHGVTPEEAVIEKNAAITLLRP